MRKLSFFFKKIVFCLLAFIDSFPTVCVCKIEMCRNQNFSKYVFKDLKLCFNDSKDGRCELDNLNSSKCFPIGRD